AASFLVLRVEALRLSVLAPSRRVDTQVAGEREQPGRKLRPLLVGRGLLDDAQEGLLRQVLGLRDVVRTDGAQDEIEDRFAMAGEQNLEGADVPLAKAEHQRFIGVAFSRRSHQSPQNPRGCLNPIWYLTRQCVQSVFSFLGHYQRAVRRRGLFRL